MHVTQYEETCWLLDILLNYVSQHHDEFAVLFDVAPKMLSTIGVFLRLPSACVVLMLLLIVGFQGMSIEHFLKHILTTQFSATQKQKVAGNARIWAIFVTLRDHMFTLNLC